LNTPENGVKSTHLVNALNGFLATLGSVKVRQFGNGSLSIVFQILYPLNGFTLIFKNYVSPFVDKGSVLLSSLVHISAGVFPSIA